MAIALRWSSSPDWRWSAMLGYRALFVDFRKGAGNTLYEFDMLIHGPIIGLTARF